eukprot:m.100872 g.100872  ORF g.100872 m.100872 type:complete len:55 (+) comp9052_c0_seq1:8159-8323(+)
MRSCYIATETSVSSLLVSAFVISKVEILGKMTMVMTIDTSERKGGLSNLFISVS